MIQTFGEVTFLGLHKAVCTQLGTNPDQSVRFGASCLIIRVLRKAIMTTAMGVTVAYSSKTSRELDKHVRERGPLFPT